MYLDQNLLSDPENQKAWNGSLGKVGKDKLKALKEEIKRELIPTVKLQRK